MNILIKTVASAHPAAITLRKWMDVNERSFCLFSTSLSFPILLPTKPHCIRTNRMGIFFTSILL